MGYLLILIGLALVVWGISLVRRPNETKKTKKNPKESNHHQTKKSDFDDENKAKGDAFVAFVVKHFDKRYFTLQEWRGDKYVEGNYPVSSHFPDLEVKFSLNSKNVSECFAIECKWRKQYYKNCIEWAQDYQIKNYKEYSAKINIPVFVVIGLGGEPDSPNELFIIPLAKLESNTICKEEIKKYKRDTVEENFFWDFENNVLK